MKIILILLLTSCTVTTRKGFKTKSVSEKIRSCVDSMISKHGVEANKSYEICKKIYKNE